MEENVIQFDDVEQKIIELRGTQIILDSDVAALYGVATREVNQAIKNNLGKFPNESYLFELTYAEKVEVIKIFDNPPERRFSPVLPKAFTEKGLYMVATILKSKRATLTTLAIVEAFAKLRAISRTMMRLSESSDEAVQKNLAHENDLCRNGGCVSTRYRISARKSAGWKPVQPCAIALKKENQ